MAVTFGGKNKIMKSTRLYVGEFDLSGDALQIGSLPTEYNEVPFGGMSRTFDEFLVGYGNIGIDGLQVLMNDAASGAYTVLNGGNSSDQTSVCFGSGGSAPTAGDPAFLLPSIQFGMSASLNSERTVLDIPSFRVDASQYSANYRMPLGVVLQGAISLSATVTASSSNSVDAGGSTSNGWSANLHIIASSGGSWVIRIEHSTDDSTFATLGTFTANGSAVTSEFLTGSGTVNRYVAAELVRTSGTLTAVITFARNYH